MNERIYLQDGVEGEVTWCSYRIKDTDTEYVRADLYKDALARIAHLESNNKSLITEKNVITGDDLQSLVAALHVERGYTSSPQTLLIGALEELGEVAQIILATLTSDYTASDRKLSPEWVNDHDLASEIGDVLTYLYGLCYVLDLHPKFTWMKKLR
jgi:NTP pyrophosphatase (non-canonical NTP hydrolase)